MNKPNIIHCLQCGNAVIHYDGRSSVNQIADCRKCMRRIIYHVDSGEIETKKIPKRVSSSGITFC